MALCWLLCLSLIKLFPSLRQPWHHMRSVRHLENIQSEIQSQELFIKNQIYKTLLCKSCWSVRYRPKHPYLWQSQCSSCETLRASKHASSWGPCKHDPRGHRLWMFCVFIVMNRTSFAGIIHLAEWIFHCWWRSVNVALDFITMKLGEVLVIACIQYDGLATSECIPKG